jgi:hypothetical protein
VQEAYDYLHEWITNPTSRVHPHYGKVHFDISKWGYEGQESCMVCVAGLYYLRKYDLLLGIKYRYEPYPKLAEFLDDLTYSGADDDALIEEYLGVHVPSGLRDRLVGGGLWDSDQPEHLLAFLQWLLGQRTPGGNSND